LTRMKTSIHRHSFGLTVVAGLAIAACAMVTAAEPKKHGTDILHLSIRERMVNGGVTADASGQAELKWDKQGHANHQEVHLHLKGLDSDTDYQLAASTNDGSNATPVLTFTTDDEGRADIDLRDKGPKPQHAESKNGKVKAQLPPELEPVTQINQVLVLDTNGATVLTGSFDAPDKFELLVKRDLSTADIRAKLEIHANQHKGKLRLEAKGLQPGIQYSLALNGTVADSEMADNEGKVHLRAELDNPADILTLMTVDLLDADSNVVVSATLP